MKPARFILNSDYTTVRNTGVKELSLTIPDDFTILPPATTYTIGKISTYLDNDADSFAVYFSSDRFNYTCPGTKGYTAPDGSVSRSPAYGDSHEVINFVTSFEGNKVTMELSCSNYNSSYELRYIGYGQTITAHILTFKDPFSA